MSNYKKMEEEEGRVVNPFANIEKSAVMQESRKFNAMPIKPRECSLILAKIMCLIFQGETYAQREATEIFFAMTKLFQHKDTNMRKMMYLTIKAMSTMADDVIIVTSSLTKDMTGKTDEYRAGAIRALCAIIEGNMLQSLERYFKQSIVDKNAAVASAALVSSLHMMKENYEVVKRWVNEVTQALNSKDTMVQYHALGLLYHIKSKDRLAIAKLVTTQMRGSNLRSPYALCLLIRYASEVMAQDTSSTADSAMFEFLESCLRNKNEMVIYEAARAIVNIPNVTPRELAQSVAVLQLFLTSPKATLRFAAVRTLNKVAMVHPASLKTCNLDMENLITDSNRSIATLAITTLLKTGNESSVDRLMKQITSFLSEISDEFKIVVVNAIKVLCMKFPKKHTSMMTFLSGVLRDDGGFEYKKVVVDTIVEIIQNVPEAKEPGLEQLCEFIEDCEFTTLLVRILHMLGQEGPNSSNPRKYIRFVYNRLILENATVRAAAVSALAQFGTRVDALRPSVLVLLKRCLADLDDEVRDRATFYVSLVEKENTALVSKYMTNGLDVSMSALERSLVEYKASEEAHEEPFNMKTVPIHVEEKKADLNELGEEMVVAAGSAGPKVVTADQYREQLAEVTAFEDFGNLFRSSETVKLTEAETEYGCTCVKHVFEDYIVFQFNVTNTLDDQVLESVKVKLTELDDDECIIVPAPVVKYGEPGVCYTAIALDPTDPSQTYECALDFSVKDCDPETGDVDDEAYPDTYELEELEVSLSDCMLPVDKPNFGAAWEELTDACASDETYELPMDGIEDAVTKIVAHMGMKACEKSDRPKSGKNTHTLYLAGVYVGGHQVLARARLAYDAQITLQLEVRGTDDDITTLVASSVG